ncbi:MAG: hypothetical protein ACR2OU_10195, partial [Thermomicrobiales bacterium]
AFRTLLPVISAAVPERSRGISPLEFVSETLANLHVNERSLDCARDDVTVVSAGISFLPDGDSYIRYFSDEDHL